LLLRRKIEEESSLLRRKIEELNKNTVLLIAEAGRLIEGSKQLSDRLKSFENPAKRESASRFHSQPATPFHWLNGVGQFSVVVYVMARLIASIEKATAQLGA